MESESEGEDIHQNKKNKINSGNEGQSKPKRRMKTPFQLETLEKAYANETYPSESTRADLSEKLGLSDRQLQMWFCHRRLKDKKDVVGRKSAKVAASTPPMPEFHVGELRVKGEQGSDYGSRSGSASGSGSSPFRYRKMGKTVQKNVEDDVSIGRRYYESSPQSIMELRAIACAEAQLGEPLRDDGPIYGMEFDPLPPYAFGAPIAATVDHQKRSGYPAETKAAARVQEHQFRQDQSSVRSDVYGKSYSHMHAFLIDSRSARHSSSVRENGQMSRAHDSGGRISHVHALSQRDKQVDMFSSPPRDNDSIPKRGSLTDARISMKLVDHTVIKGEDQYALSDGQMFDTNPDLRVERHQKSDEARISREAGVHEIQIRRELEKQDILRRKSEERIRKEMEKHERERRKEEERLMRERQRDEERLQREQKREIERRERFMQRELERAEKIRQKEELRREKDAVRHKAAIEKATARKIAKDSMDLIEDEQLELMELAAASKGLSSVINLDHDTMQNLELFRGSLIDFPPKSVVLKRPFAIQPWADSEESVGNLLMVWKFLLAYADILGLWPFTLDEFVQAFHDYDSRLLGEIHVALLRVIIKDIEDVARPTFTGLVMNQNGSSDPEGGHPHIVEGAYAWGFDIRNWKKHLNPLTWPEVLRQLALSAGFGPRLKKTGISRTYWRDSEGKDCEDAVSTIRSGSAAVNAFSIMQEKGLLAPRRSRHRLTPGTVKFAAYHVLSLEGSKGLTVLELSDKIQKSGLRDLSTSKTPEASISVALTRDTKLFERIAPSTYCVRAPFRKDPADAEALLLAARKKIQIFENGFLPEEDADVIERDEDSECEVDEDPEVDDIAILSSANNNAEHSNEVNACSENGKGNFCNDVALTLKDEFDKDLKSVPVGGSKDVNVPSTAGEHYVTGEDNIRRNLDQNIVEIDESKSSESWIQGLTKGEYSDLSVEERLNALVALIGIANEGNTIRAALEDRLDAANSLNKQMWAESQLDKVRLKDENVPKLDFSTGSKAEEILTSAAAGGNQSPLSIIDINNEAYPITIGEQKSFMGSESIPNNFNGVLNEKTSLIQDFSKVPYNFIIQQQGHTSKRTRSVLKLYIAHRAEEMYVYRSLPLGQDRRRNRYWLFVASASRNDPGCGRIFVEFPDGKWRLIDSEEGFDTLLVSLDVRGIRESHLRIMLQCIESSFKLVVRRNLQCNLVQLKTTVGSEVAEMNFNRGSPSSTICAFDSDKLETLSPFRIDLGRNEIEKNNALERYQDLQRWMWKECFNSSTLWAMNYEKKGSMQLGICDYCLDSDIDENGHCHLCHQIFGNCLSFSREIQCEDKKKLNPTDIYTIDSSVPLRIRLLKAILVLMEVSVVPEALHSSWIDDHRRTWIMKLKALSSAEELLQFVTIVEGIIKRESLSLNFETTKELLGSCSLSESDVHDFSDPGSVPVLPWIPKTSAAVALRLLDLDASIFYVKNEKGESCEDKEVMDMIKVPSRYAPLKNNKELELIEQNQDQHVKGKNGVDIGNGRSNKRGRGGRVQGRSRKWLNKVRGSKSVANKQKSRYNNNLVPGQGLDDQRTDKLGSGRGPRTVRRRPEKRPIEDKLLVEKTEVVSPKSSGESDMDGDEEEWGIKRMRMLDREAADNRNFAAEMESDEDDQRHEQGWRGGLEGTSNGWTGGLMDQSDDDMEEAWEGGNDIHKMRDADSEGDVDISEGETDSPVSEDYSE